MEKLQQPWLKIISELQNRLKSSEVSLRQVSKDSGVDYYAVRRYAYGQGKNRTTNAIRLCNYYGIATEVAEARMDAREQELIDIIRTVWDGTPSHAKLLLRLIQCADGVSVRNLVDNYRLGKRGGVR